MNIEQYLKMIRELELDIDSDKDIAGMFAGCIETMMQNDVIKEQVPMVEHLAIQFLLNLLHARDRTGSQNFTLLQEIAREQLAETIETAYKKSEAL